MAVELKAGERVPRCRTRVLAVHCLRDLVRTLADVPRAPSQQCVGIEWLEDLVAVGFTAATSTVHTLRPQGLHLLLDLILVHTPYPISLTTEGKLISLFSCTAIR